MNETIERTPKGWKTLQAISVIVMCFAILKMFAAFTNGDAIAGTPAAWLMILGGCGYIVARIGAWWCHG